jgi:hypothetical protein
VNDLKSNPISLESKDLDPTDNEGVRDALMEAFKPLRQPGGRIADKQLGVAAIDPQHFKNSCARSIRRF